MYWKGEYLGSFFALDTETELIHSPGYIPRIVLTVVSNGKEQYIIKNENMFVFLNMHKESTIIMHHAPFDIEVLKQAFKFDFSKAIEEDRILDTRILYLLINLAKTGSVPRKSSLAVLAAEYLDIHLDKDASIREGFGQFLTDDNYVMYDSIPDEFLRYALNDVQATWHLYEILIKEVKDISFKYKVDIDCLLSHKIQLMGSLALYSIERNGIGFDQKGRLEKLEVLEKEIEEPKRVLLEHGFERGKKGIKAVYEQIINSLGIQLPKTETGKISSAAEDLKPYSHIPFIKAYMDFHDIEKTMSFIKEIEVDRLHPRYNNLMETGRTSSFGPNIQQLPRAGGIRELFVPREGHVFIDIDYTALELCTLAQTNIDLFGFSRMAELINEGRDLHKYAASQIYGVSEEEVDKQQRHLAKILNFGLGANMSPATFVDYARPFGINLSLKESTTLKNKWANIFPEMRRFWNVDNHTVNILSSGRIRSRCRYTNYLNTYFQGLAADGAKIALYSLYKEGYKIAAFIHDQVLIEVESGGNVAEKMLKIQNIMEKSMQILTPDVKIRTEGQITLTFTK
jgi:DNA polymerase I-like protein with 3'-5' exonuclease and polymerase domains